LDGLYEGDVGYGMELFTCSINVLFGIGHFDEKLPLFSRFEHFVAGNAFLVGFSCLIPFGRISKEERVVHFLPSLY
jgi:hypothetical protein